MKAIEAAERGASDAMAEWVAWCNRYGVDIRNRADAIEVDIGEIEATSCDARGGMPSHIASRVRTAFEKWTEAGQDPERFRRVVVKFQYNGVTSTRRVWQALR